MKKKIVITSIISLSLALLIAVGVTVAYLFVKSEQVVNVFTPSDISIELEETERDYKMIPGVEMPKDPTVTVTADIDCYVFVKIVETGSVEVVENGVTTTYTLDDFLTYAINETAWKVYSGVVDENDSTSGNETIVLYCEVAAGTHTFPVIAGNIVTTNTSVTKQMMNACSSDTIKLTFDAGAVQKANLSLDAAYAQLGW